MFTISNTERCLFVQDCENIKMAAKTGDNIPVGSVAYECLKQKKPISIIVSEHVFGVSIRGMGVTVFEAGKGFNIVAGEIRKLSKSSADSIKEINDVLNNIQSSISEILKRFNDSNITVIIDDNSKCCIFRNETYSIF